MREGLLPIHKLQIPRSVDRYEGVGRFFGTIKALPEKDGRNNKGAIGFYRAEAGALGDPSSFPDVRGCEGIRFKLRSEGWDYSGFLVGFGSTKPRNSTGRFSRARGYRAELHMPPQKGDEYVNVELPFGSFTSEWDAGSGSEIAACQDDSHDEGSSNCPDDKTKVGDRFSPGAFPIFLQSLRLTFSLSGWKTRPTLDPSWYMQKERLEHTILGSRRSQPTIATLIIRPSTETRTKTTRQM